MSEPAYELTDEEARRGVVGHLTIDGERMPVIIPGSVIEALRVFADLLRSEAQADILPAALLHGMPWTRSLPPADLPALAAELADAAAGPDAPERLATLIREWKATAAIYDDPELLAALTGPHGDYGPVPEPAG